MEEFGNLTNAEKALFLTKIKENEKKEEIKRINLRFSNEIKNLVSDYSEEEQKTWGIQEAEAKALLLDATAITPMLDAIADGSNKVALASKVISKAELLKVASGTLFAERNRALVELEDETI